MSRRHALLVSIPAIALLLVAAANRTMVATTDLSAWELGGFGMFSTVDAPDTRVLRITGTTADGRTVDVTPPPTLADPLGRLRVWPDRARTRALASNLFDLRWAVEDGEAAEASDGVLLSSIAVELGRISVDDDELRFVSIVEESVP